MKSIAIVFTGGTISMTRGEGGAVPTLDGTGLLSSWPMEELPFRVHPVDFGRHPSPHMHGARLLQLHQTVRRALADHDGVVVTHGTDSIEETAVLLDLWHDQSKPLVVTGAMRTSDAPGWDGDLNLLDACRVAADAGSAGHGVLLVMNRLIHAASEVTKAFTDAIDPLVSQPAGPLGKVTEDRVEFYRAPRPRPRLAPPPTDTSGTDLPWVELLTAHPDSDQRVVDALVDSGCQGLVVRAMGMGNLSPSMADALKRIAATGLPVVLVSRCFGGEPGADYGYRGGGAELIQSGLVLCRRLNDLKCRVALTWLLQAKAGIEQIRAFFAGASH